jgi:hypothetical protein
MALAGCVIVIEDIHEYSGPMIIAATAENAITRNNFLRENELVSSICPSVFICYGTPGGGTVF